MASIKIPTPLRAYTNNQAQVDISGKTVGEALNDLMAALTTEKLTELNGRISVDREQAEVVAKDFLTSEGLI